MGWLDERLIEYVYRDDTGAEVVMEYPASEDPPVSYVHENKTFTKTQMLPYKTNLTFKIQFERNGLVAYKYDQGDGRPRVVSATRENYEKNIGSMSGDKLRELKASGRMSEVAPSITTKGYQDTFKKVQAKKGVSNAN